MGEPTVIVTQPGEHVSPGTKNLRAGGPGEKAEST
jgi:hypothetical protein